ncbi:uncharacterized protein EDB93DRAFT_1106210 [Suillus bovinus]|uniref:uncharacterized protein n=1 Tax=Suillus bovinus TaxID=48563 RepID=UPI001B85F427|nr:uncharacterized protein EDB93DRAFT_1106210 [Suillus bovinus]KAG2139106.1 hypothetical protein EDB93DRAFT_1106210 [Suillus bovinus]
MNNSNYANANGEIAYKIPQHLLQHTPRPREVVFVLTGNQLELMYNTWVVVRRRVCQRIYQPELPFPPYPPHPVWSDEAQSMMILWVARERHMFELEMAELEHILGL